MNTRQRSARRRAGGTTSRTSPARLQHVKAILASQQMPGLPPDVADRIRRALAVEAADRAGAAASESHQPVRIPRPRTGKQRPPLTHLVPWPRRATHAA